MILYLEHVAWSGLAALAVLFISIAARLREDREFALLGSGMALLCLVVATDVWIFCDPQLKPAFGSAWLAALQNAQQFAACAYVWVALRFTQSLTGRPGRTALRVHAALLTALCLGFYVDILSPVDLFVAETPDGFFTVTWAFDFIYSPYLILLFAWNVALTFRGWRQAGGDARRTLGALAFAYSLLFLGGFHDFLGAWLPVLRALPSATVLAALSMCGIGTYLFTARLIRLYQNQRETLLKIAAIHGDLEAHRSLGELGKSAAHISESIRDFVSGMKTDAEALRRHPATASRAEVARIENARRRLEAFTEGILDFSRSARPGERRPLALPALAAECVASFPAAFQARVRVEGECGRSVPGDSAMLKRALVHLVRNAFDAGSRHVRIRLREGLCHVSIAIEDDGPGFPFDQLNRVVTPFFTTRKSAGACGLGASVAQGVFRSHGGNLSYYPAPPPAASGLLANGILPLAPIGANAFSSSVGREWILVCDDAARIERFLTACAGVGINPAVRGSSQPVAGKGGSPFAIVDAAAGPVAGLPAQWKRFRLAGDHPEGDAGTEVAYLREETLVELGAAVGVAFENRL